MKDVGDERDMNDGAKQVRAMGTNNDRETHANEEGKETTQTEKRWSTGEVRLN